MTLYFDSKINFNETGVISTILEWHPAESMLAVASYSQTKGGIITIFDGNGVILHDSNDIPQLGQQASALSWHPQRAMLAVGWESGSLHLWKHGSGWLLLSAPHSAPPLLLKWSNGGGRLIISDAASAVTGWRSTASGLLMAYHLTLDEPITHAAFCLSGAGISEGVVRGLAKAAIAGDESALDVLASWRPRTAPRAPGSIGDNHALYAAQQNGNILFIDEAGTCSEVLPSVGNIQFMEMNAAGYLIIAWENTGTLSLTRFATTAKKGGLDAKMHVKMTTRVGLDVCSVGGSLIAILAGEKIIRIWDSETNDNFTLPFEESTPTHNSEMFTCMSYNALNSSLCCGSNQGRIFIWHKNVQGQWKIINICSVKGSVKQICWGSESGLRPLIAVNSITSVSILREQPICWGYTNQVWGIQTGPMNITLEAPKNAITNVTTEICIKAMCLNETYLAISDGKQVQVFKLSKETFNFHSIHKFSWVTETLLIHEETLVGIVASRIEAKTISGKSLGFMPTLDGEGEPIGISRTESYMAIATMDGCIKVVEITKKGFRSQYNPKNCYQLFDDFGEIMYAAVNCAGRLVCLAIANANLVPEPKLYIWDAANDTLNHTVLKDTDGQICVPVTICWDSIDSRLVSCHVRSTADDYIKCLFIHAGGLTEYTNWRGNAENQTGQNLCTISTPYIITMYEGKLIKNIMIEFVGSEDCDVITRKYLLDFLYNMTLGHMEQAVLAIGHTNAGETVWQGLARACVPQKRLDVASVCLAKMNNIKGALALHMAMEDPKLSDKSRTAILAIHLGMLDEAKMLFEEDKRFDLISRMTAATRGGLEKLTQSSMEGEVTLLVKNAHFRLGCLKRDSGKLESAAECFEKADVEVPHVPRMLLHSGQIELLKKRVETANKPELYLWWAHYLESQGELDDALEFYGKANDFGARGRLLCHMDRLQDAYALAENPAAAYYIARHLEIQPDQIEDAIKYYMRAGAPSAAVRCGAEAQLWDQVVRAGTSTVANIGNAHTLLAATVLEKAGRAPAAAHLYHQAGKLHKAVEVALLAEGDTGADALARVAESLASGKSGGCAPELAKKLIVPLLDRNQPLQAVKILASAQLFNDALDLVEEHNLDISEDLTELLTPDKGAENRSEILQQLADLLGRRGHYHLAAKKLTQAGDKIAAMRWLVKSGDADKMVFFASVSRDRTVYLMAARALQAADWRARPDLLRHVASFYTRARAPRPLAAFYAACAQQEIDDYQNYEKAAGALSEALRCLTRSTDPLAATDAAMLQSQADQVQRYISIEKGFNRGEYHNSISSGKQLLEDVDDKGPVRAYHILRLMASKATAAGNIQESKEYTEQARIFEKRAETLDVERRGSDTPSPDQEVPEFLPEELPAF